FRGVSWTTRRPAFRSRPATRSPATSWCSAGCVRGAPRPPDHAPESLPLLQVFSEERQHTGPRVRRGLLVVRTPAIVEERVRCAGIDLDVTRDLVAIESSI